MKLLSTARSVQKNNNPQTQATWDEKYSLTMTKVIAGIRKLFACIDEHSVNLNTHYTSHAFWQINFDLVPSLNIQNLPGDVGKIFCLNVTY